MPGAHRKKTPGRHRKASSLPLTWRTTGGLIVGAAVLGTAAATAQASVLPFGSAPAASTAADAPGKKPPGGSSKDSSKDGARKAAKNDPGKSVPKKPAAKAPGKPSAKPSGASRPTAAEAIELARSQVGVEEDRGGETKFQKWYMGTARAKETLARDGGSLAGYGDANWCDMFVSWVGERIGFGDQIGSDAWTVAHARWFKKHGRWGTEPRPGAIVFYAWDGGKDVTDIRHVGMVIKKIDARRHRGGRGQHRQRRADQEAVGRRRRRLRLPRLPVLMTRSS
ncbi:CHAP domain-containing protein [Actinomadura madurae]|uniref:CHAP domain-containing protein n=1 Tax=Actinomadura madurae TaxID=1993 RepID=UPI0020D2442E|nr:CHAP domain-containing protein [Actinomadura madurae]MCP9954812.1 CHAP domain-containing protein [Actinomadura madurae]